MKYENICRDDYVVIDPVVMDKFQQGLAETAHIHRVVSIDQNCCALVDGMAYKGHTGNGMWFVDLRALTLVEDKAQALNDEKLAHTMSPGI